MVSNEDRYDMMYKAKKALKKMKDMESSSKMYTKKLNKYTIVSSNKKSNLDLYHE